MVSWIAFKAFLKRAWAWCKKNWKIFLGASIPIIILIIAGRSSSAKNLIAKIREDYEKEIDVIDRAHEKEIADIELAQKRYAESVERIENEFLENREELDSKKKKEIQKIISENADNPGEITRRISEITGFDIHVS
jgi:vacuolar-type H+-ATPase subunit H